MIHKMKLRPIYFDMIKSGEKIFEVRLNDEKRKMIKPNDVIEFQKEPELVETQTKNVDKLIVFSSFGEMAKTLPLERVGFAGKTPAEVEKVYYQFYSKEDEARFGVLAIKLK